MLFQSPSIYGWCTKILQNGDASVSISAHRLQINLKSSQRVMLIVIASDKGVRPTILYNH